MQRKEFIVDGSALCLSILRSLFHFLLNCFSPFGRPSMKAGIFFFSLYLLFNPGGSPPSHPPTHLHLNYLLLVRWRLWGGRGGSFFLCLLRIPPLFFSSSFLTTSIKPFPSLPPPPPYPFYRLPGNPSQRKDPPSLPPSLLFILPSCCFSGGKKKRKEGRKGTAQ